MEESSILTFAARSPLERAATYTLLGALIERRSRRFGKGMHLNGGPLAYRSALPPQPLQSEEEAALAFAACGITGHALADLPYQDGDVGWGKYLDSSRRPHCGQRRCGPCRRVVRVE
jgi:hypothetical protein